MEEKGSFSAFMLINPLFRGIVCLSRKPQDYRERSHIESSEIEYQKNIEYFLS